MRNLKKIVCLFLVFASVFVGTFTINLNAFADAISDAVRGDNIAYITDKDNINEKISIRDSDRHENVDVSTFKPNNISKIKANSFKNICVDGNLSDDVEIKQTLKHQFDSGSMVLIRKDNMTVKEIYQYFGIEKKAEYFNPIDEQKENDDKLKVVAVSIKKNTSGEINTEVISVEDYTNEQAVQKAIAYSVKHKTTDSIEEKKTSLIEFSNNVANATGLCWNPIASNTWLDAWVTVNVSYSVVLQENPNCPDSQGKYYTMVYSAVDVQPTSSAYGYSDVYFRHSGGGTATIYDYGPTVSSSTDSISFSFAYPNPTISVGANIGITTGVAIPEGGINSTSVKWDFYPKIFGLHTITSKSSHYALASEYRQSSRFYTGSLNYSIEMYNCQQGDYPIYVATASKSNRSVTNTL